MSVRRPLLLPFVPLYRAGLWWNSRRRSQHPAMLRYPVLSVGSISAGGAGKTPFTIALARLLATMGYTADILSRGYGRTSTATVRVEPDGNPATFGDEPLLLARTLGLPVYVGRSRHAAGLLAERDLAPAGNHVHLLDDGFSHRALARTADILLLTAADLHDTLLPAGNLREPRSALARATLLVLRAAEEPELRRYLATRPALQSKPVWIVDRTTTLPSNPPSKPLLFSAIGRPADLYHALRAHGITPAAIRAFPDHHSFTRLDMIELCGRARRAHADGFLTTAKDAVKLDTSMRAQLASIGPLTLADVALRFQNPEGCAADLHRLLS